MIPWLAAAWALLLGLIPCGYVIFSGGPMERLAGLEMAGGLQTVVLVLLSEGFHNPNFLDLALAMALLTFGGGLVFVRFAERWL